MNKWLQRLKLNWEQQQYLDDALAGAERQTHQTRPIYGHDLVSDVQSTRLLSRTSVHHAGDDDGGQDGPPARLHYHHTQDLSFLLLDVNLRGNASGFICTTFPHHKVVIFTSSCWINYGNIQIQIFKHLLVKKHSHPNNMSDAAPALSFSRPTAPFWKMRDDSSERREEGLRSDQVERLKFTFTLRFLFF